MIYITIPCEAAYLNEASNSWWLYTHPGQRWESTPWVIDPFGPCGGGNPLGWYPQ